MPSLRLGQKLFLAFAAIIMVVVALVSWNLVITERLTRQNQTIVRQVLPAVRLEVMLRDSVLALRRLEARGAVLRDQAYRTLFEERARAMASDLARLASLVTTDREQAALREVEERLDAYVKLVGGRGLASSASAGPADRLEAALEQLYAHSEGELRRLEAHAEDLLARTRFFGLLSLAMSVLVGGAISAFAVMRVVRPLRQLRTASQKVAEREFREPIPVRGQDEVAELTRAFNQMAVKLRELDDLKEEFFSAISHELRTPLTAIQMSATLLHEGAPGPLTEKQGRLVEITRVSVNRLLGLINQILDLGSLRAGKLRLDLRTTDLGKVVEAAVEEIRPLADDGKLTLAVTIAPDLPKILVDEGRIQQVLVNLLGNSVKFTQPGGQISVSVGREADRVVVKVTDSGIGIASHLLPSIFNRYQQAHKGHGGTGIGLALVKGFVEAHGGRVWVESEEKRGSCFGFAIPVEGRAG